MNNLHNVKESSKKGRSKDWPQVLSHEARMVLDIPGEEHSENCMFLLGSNTQQTETFPPLPAFYHACQHVNRPQWNVSVELSTSRSVPGEASALALFSVESLSFSGNYPTIWKCVLWLESISGWDLASFLNSSSCSSCLALNKACCLPAVSSTCLPYRITALCSLATQMHLTSTKWAFAPEISAWV